MNHLWERLSAQKVPPTPLYQRGAILERVFRVELTLIVYLFKGEKSLESINKSPFCKGGFRGILKDRFAATDSALKSQARYSLCA